MNCRVHQKTNNYNFNQHSKKIYCFKKNKLNKIVKDFQDKTQNKIKNYLKLV